MDLILDEARDLADAEVDWFLPRFGAGFVWLVVAVVGYASIRSLPSARAVAVVCVLVAVALFLNRHSGIALPMVVLPTVPYMMVALWVADTGSRLWPFPDMSAYRVAASYMVGTFFLSIFVLSLFDTFPLMSLSMATASSMLSDIGESPLVRGICCAILGVLGVQAWSITLKTGIDLEAGRRLLESAYWMSGTVTGQAVAIGVSLILVTRVFETRSWFSGGFLLAIVGFSWAPFLLGGGRRLATYLLVMCFAATWYRIGKRARFSVVVLGASAVALFVMIPVMSGSGGTFAAHGEWSMSAAPLVALASGALTLDDAGADGVPRVLLRALPDWLGGGRAVPLADALAQTDLYPAGTSGNPWSDSWVSNSLMLNALAFILTLVVLLLLFGGAVRRWPLSVFGVVASCFVLGRSHFPYFIDTAAYFSGVLILLQKVAEATSLDSYWSSGRSAPLGTARGRRQ